MGGRVQGHYKLLFPNEYLAAPDLRGRDVTLTIDRVEVESLKREDGAEDKPVVHFREMQRRPPKQRKRWVLNKTNATQIAVLHGNDVLDWEGKRVVLYATTCQAFGQIVECIRVRPRIPQGRAEPGDLDDDSIADDFAPGHREPQGDEIGDPRDHDAP